MADNKRISELPEVTSLGDTDVVAVVASGVTSKIEKQNLVTTLGLITDISGQDLSTADNTTSAFITAGDIPSIPADVADLTDNTGVIPTDTSDLANSAGFITAGDVSANETDPVFTAWTSSPSLSAGLDMNSTSISNASSVNGVELTTGTGALVLDSNTLTIAGGDVTITGAGSATITVPDTTGTMALTSDLTSFITDISGQDLSTADNATSAFITASSSDALENKTYEGNTIATGTGTIDVGANTLEVTGGNVTLDGTGTGTYTMPSASDTLVGLTSTDMLTNKSFGSTSHHSKFGASGALTMTGNARIRKRVFLGMDGIGQGATAPTITRLGNSYGYAFTINDDGYVNFEIPADWDSSTAINLTLHVYTNEAYATNSGEIRFEGAWAGVTVDNHEAIDSPTHSGTMTGDDMNIDTTAKAVQEYAVGSIANTSIGANDQITVKLKRIALAGGNNPTAEPVVIFAEFDYVANKLGTALTD